MKKLLLVALFLFGAQFASAQGPTQCLYAGVWTPCSLIAVPQLAQSINVKVSGGSGTTIAQAFGSNTVAGNSIVCLAFESAAAIPVITDGQSNTYAVVASSATAPGYTISVAQNIVGGTTDTVTATVTSGAAAFQCAEVKGSAYVGQAWDLFNGQQGTGSTITFAAAAATNPGELVLAAAGLGAGTVNATPALGGNNTSLVTVDASNTAVTGGAALSVFYAAHTSLSAANTFTQTMSLNASQTYSGLLVSIRPAALPSVMVGAGAAGTPAGGLVTVQGAASMTKLLVTPDANVKVDIVGNAGANVDAATGAAPPANAVLLGGLTSGATGGFVTAMPICDSFANINISTATTTLLVTGVSGRHVRICHIDMVALAADNVGIISGTGSTCGTGSGAIVGTTSATGYNFAANGGISSGSGFGTIMRTVATGDSVCLITSAATQLSGVIAYTIY